MTPKNDRTVHGITPDGCEIVRYDRAGKWYLEDGAGKRVRALRIADAAALAAQGRAHLDKPGGQSFDKKVRNLRASDPHLDKQHDLESRPDAPTEPDNELEAGGAHER